MAAVAREAGVSRETVYTAVGGKASLLKAVYDRAVAGDDESVPVLDRAAARALLADPDLERACADYGRATAGIVERLGPILVVMAGAPTDAELAEVVTTTRAERLVGSRLVLEGLARGPVPPAALDRAADVHWALVSPEVALLLVRDRGWSFDHYAAWVAEETFRQVRELRAPVSSPSATG